jgi:pilus assembly protein CpaF
VNGADRVFVEKAGFVEEVHGLSIGEKSLMVAVKNIARRLGDDISEHKPILDSRLPDGSRVAAVIPPCSLNGVTLTIRKFNSRHFGIEDLIKVGTIERSLANQLESFVLARKNILITGGTGTGKTTLVNILGKFIPPDERIILIEDTSEIQMDQDNLVRFEARQPQNGLPAGRRSISCSFSIRVTLAVSQPSTQRPLSKDLPGLRAASSRAELSFRIAPSRATSAIPLTL